MTTRQFSRKETTLLVWISVGAAVLRLLWIYFVGDVIENEGTGYARLAENLAAAHGYAGITGGRDTILPPLYALLIAGASTIIRDHETAARLVSCVAGTAMVWPMYTIARALGGRAAGQFGAGLAAVHGVLIGFSGSTYCESLYFFLLFSGLALLMQSASAVTLVRCLLGGMCFGLAHLVRPEGAIFFALSLIFFVGGAFIASRPLRETLARGALISLAFVVVVSPYVAWLSLNSGYLRWEGKSVYNARISSRMSDGVSFAQASFELGPGLERLGPELVDDKFALPGNASFGARVAFQTISRDFLSRAFALIREWSRQTACGGPVVVVLSLAGFAWAFKRGPRRFNAALVFSCGVLYLILLLSLFTSGWQRYMFPLTFFALPWAAAGCAALVPPVGTLLAFLWKGSDPAMFRSLVRAALVVLVGTTSLRAAAKTEPFAQSYGPQAAALKEAGLWLRSHAISHNRQLVVMGVSAVVPYYAGATLAYLPWPTGGDAQAIAYVHEREPDFVVLRTAERAAAPYIDSWTHQRIPDPCALLRRVIDEGPEERLFLYEWACSDNGSSKADNAH
jgi:hypothetical protein